MLGKELAHDGVDAQILEHARGVAQAQQCERRLDGERVAGKTAITRQRLGGADHAAAQRFAAIGAGNAEPHRQPQQ
ncbi:hypothetical protein D3C72_2100600 [compost metagenome]